MGPESSITLPSCSFTCRLTRVSICLVVVSSVFRFVIHSSEGKRKKYGVLLGVAVKCA